MSAAADIRAERRGQQSAGACGRIYAAIDLKSFYASVECADRGLDPLRTNLVVADTERTDKTICLAVSPSLKAHGIPGRPRLFEVVERVREINADRLHTLRRSLSDEGAFFRAASFDAAMLETDPALRLSYITARPRMARYMEVSEQVYSVYLRYVAPEDIIVYSVDEVFLDLTPYLGVTGMTAHELVMTMVKDVLRTTGITATAGIGTNLYLAKVGMDIVAKHAKADADGVRIAALDEQSYRRLLWGHRPLTDFWRIGSGYRRRLEACGLYTMGDIARCSLGGEHDMYNEALLYRMFGVNAELLIDHAWGYEPCTVADVRAYRPRVKSLSSGQVLKEPYPFSKARLIVKEMADSLSLQLAEKGLLTDQLTLSVGYDRESLSRPGIRYGGPTERDHYGREVPKAAHGSVSLSSYTSGTRELTEAAADLFDRIAGRDLLVRRIRLAAEHVRTPNDAQSRDCGRQLSLFEEGLCTDAGSGAARSVSAAGQKRDAGCSAAAKEHHMQLAVLKVRRRFGKNALLRGMNLEEGGTAIERNVQIGGHRS